MQGLSIEPIGELYGMFQLTIAKSQFGLNADAVCYCMHFKECEQWFCYHTKDSVKPAFICNKFYLNYILFDAYRVMNVNLKAVLFVSQVNVWFSHTDLMCHLCTSKSSIFCVQYVAKGMVERGEGGAIVNVSSLSSLCALKDHSVYCKLVHTINELILLISLISRSPLIIIFPYRKSLVIYTNSRIFMEALPIICDLFWQMGPLGIFHQIFFCMDG